MYSFFALLANDFVILANDFVIFAVEIFTAENAMMAQSSQSL
jgi:hypothetical protein